MNTFKKTGGFTLVELIIVIAILAILSSVAVAGYSSYITKAHDSNVNTFESGIKSHAVLANAMAGTDVTVTFTYAKATDKLTIKIESAGYAKDFETDFENGTGYSIDAYNAAGSKIDANSSDKVVKYYQCEIDAPEAYKNSTKGK